MASVNKVTIIGNLGRDPELRFTQGGTAVCNLNIATTRVYKDKSDEKVEETEWHRVTVWGKTAENCNKFLSKGKQAYVEGRLKTSSYEDKDGVKKYSTEIVADQVLFLGSKGDAPRNDTYEAPAEDDDDGPGF
jgi:single-strand DNA-binding protein